jgi:hypothetical protein
MTRTNLVHQIDQVYDSVGLLEHVNQDLFTSMISVSVYHPLSDSVYLRIFRSCRHVLIRL